VYILEDSEKKLLGHPDYLQNLGVVFVFE